MALEPITRQEKIIAGQDLTPITRMEKFLKQYGGGGGGSGSGQFIVIVYNADASGKILAVDKTYDEISAAIESGAAVVIHKKTNINSANYKVFYYVEALKWGGYQFCNITYMPGENVLTTQFIELGVENGKMYIDFNSRNLQPVT